MSEYTAQQYIELVEELKRLNKAKGAEVERIQRSEMRLFGEFRSQELTRIFERTNQVSAALDTFVMDDEIRAELEAMDYDDLPDYDEPQESDGDDE